MQELKRRQWSSGEHHSLAEATSCHTLAWRTLAGLEPVPAVTRDAVARPLLLAGIDKCLPLLEPPRAGVAELFEDSAWRERFAGAGILMELQPSVAQWLLDRSDGATTRAASEQALLALGVLLDTLQSTRAAIRRVLWRRVGMLGSALILTLGLVVGVTLLVSPPEGPDLGAGKPWQASSFYPGFPSSGAKPTNPTGGAFFSTGDDANPWWSIDLGKPTRVGSVTVVNRGDCCPDRAVPLAIEVSTDGQTWREVARRKESFRTWAPSFAPANARYVRLRALRRTYLHMKDVRIHAPKGK
jgi:hypothetical protein